MVMEILEKKQDQDKSDEEDSEDDRKKPGKRRNKRADSGVSAVVEIKINT